MDDNKKVYDFKGTVTISTDEYRDLISDVTAFKYEASDYRSKYWTEQNKFNEAEKKAKALEAELESLRLYVNAKEETRLAYRLFLVEMKEDKKDA